MNKSKQKFRTENIPGESKFQTETFHGFTKDIPNSPIQSFQNLRRHFVQATQMGLAS